MSNTTDDEGQQRFALGLVFVLVAVVVASVLGMAVLRSTGQSNGAQDTISISRFVSVTQVSPAPTEPAGLAPAAIVFNERAVVRVDGKVVKFFFATGKTEVADGADAALAQIIEGVQAGKRVQISGFHDATGDLAVNEELSKRRAQAVQERLLRLGVAAERVQLAKPAQTLASGSNEEARRVEVFLID